MAKVTGKLQITLPKRLADAYGIKVGDELQVLAAGRHMAVIPVRAQSASDPRERLRGFDRATERQRERERCRPLKPTKERGWSREELYGVGRSR